MNFNDKSKYDVFSHLTDIPMLGNTYVPDLWQKIGGDNIPRPSVAIQRAQIPTPVTLYFTPPSAQDHQVGMASSASVGATRTIEKRSLPMPNNTSPSSSDPQAKVPRLENNWR